MTQDIFQSDRNINSRGCNWQADIAMLMEGKPHSFQYNKKDFLLTLNFEKQHKQQLTQN